MADTRLGILEGIAISGAYWVSALIASGAVAMIYTTAIGVRILYWCVAISLVTMFANVVFVLLRKWPVVNASMFICNLLALLILGGTAMLIFGA